MPAITPEKSWSSPPLAIRVLGDFQILKGGTELELPKSRKTRALLAFLVLTGRRHRRERLCELFWDVPEDPRGSLRWSLTRLRPLVDESGHERIVANREYVFFDPQGTTVDLLEIRKELAGNANALSTERLRSLAGQFRGELLQGLAIPDHQEFQSWLLTERETAKRTRASLLHALVSRLQPEGSEDALQHARDLVVSDPYSVPAHAMLIRTLGIAGRRAEAEGQREISVRQLHEAGERDLRPLSDAIPSGGNPSASAVVNREPEKRLEQDIRFCTTSDGVRIAYASVGEGPAPIKTMLDVRPF